MALSKKTSQWHEGYPAKRDGNSRLCDECN